MAYDKPLPEITRHNRGYFEGTRQGELRLQRCSQCGRYRFPPSTHCPECLSEAFTWQPSSGRGRLWSWIVMHQRYFKAFAADLPYICALVQLEEGPLMMSTVVGAAKEELRCDLPLRVVFEEATEEISIPKFQPAEE